MFRIPCFKCCLVSLLGAPEVAGPAHYPPGPAANDAVLDTERDDLMIWDGSDWVVARTSFEVST